MTQFYSGIQFNCLLLVRIALYTAKRLLDYYYFFFGIISFIVIHILIIFLLCQENRNSKVVARRRHYQFVTKLSPGDQVELFR